MKWSDNRRYSPQELEAMQKDALERVRQMQRRSEQVLHHTRKTPSFFVEEAHPAPVQPPKNADPALPLESRTPSQNHPAGSASSDFQNKAAKTEAAPPKENGMESLLSALDLDRERLLILGLFFLLYSDGADPALLLALLFLAM